MRKYFAILAALTFFAILADADVAQARDGLYRSVAVDTSRIAWQGRVLAHNLKPLLAQEIVAAMPGRVGKSGPQLVVRVTRIKLAPVGGYDESDYQDELSAEIFVPGRGVMPILVTLPTSTGGAWYGPKFDERRVQALIQALAHWVARAA